MHCVDHCTRFMSIAPFFWSRVISRFSVPICAPITVVRRSSDRLSFVPYAQHNSTQLETCANVLNKLLFKRPTPLRTLFVLQKFSNFFENDLYAPTVALLFAAEEARGGSRAVFVPNLIKHRSFRNEQTLDLLNHRVSSGNKCAFVDGSEKRTRLRLDPRLQATTQPVYSTATRFEIVLRSLKSRRMRYTPGL